MTRLAQVFGAGLALAPIAAQAHGSIAGMGYFYSGALHPLVVPAHLISLLALGLLLGQRGIAHSGQAVVALMLSAALGLLLSGATGGPDTDTLLLVMSVVVALAVSSALAMPRWAMALLATLMGLAVGLGSSPDAAGGAERWLTLAGAWLGVVVVASWVAAMAEFARRDWMKIGVRVVSSWLAASALIVLALGLLRPVSAGRLG